MSKVSVSVPYAEEGLLDQRRKKVYAEEGLLDQRRKKVNYADPLL